MRNLYKRLNARSDASNDALQQAIIRCNDRSVKADAECVLLAPNRKALYDHTHVTLDHIAQMRNSLGLTHKENWSAPLNDEFNTGKSIPLRLDILRSISPETIKKTATPKKSKQPIDKMSWAIGISFLIFLGFLVNQNEQTRLRKIGTASPKPTQPANPTSAQPPRNTFNEPAAPLPAHGAIHRYRNAEAVAPLEVKTSYGGYYFVKLANAATGQDEIELFIHGGRTIEIDIPLGTYTMKYATGQTWYGRDHYFGPNTSYSKASSSFHFTKDYNGYSGYTVTLYKVTNGNLQTKSISPNEF